MDNVYMMILSLQVGGLLGLCVGFSFASAVEIVYWFGCRLWVGCKKTT